MGRHHAQLLALSFILLLTACADKTAKTWIGSSDTSLMASWGAPHRESRTSDGGRALTWFNPSGQCRTNFMVDRSGTITAANSDCI